jgi:hypothetical protein
MVNEAEQINTGDALLSSHEIEAPVSSKQHWDARDFFK